MKFEPFEKPDLTRLPTLQPSDWGDLVPRFSYFIQSAYCHPIKLTVGNEVVGIGTSMLHQDTAWLACIIVHADHRNKGLGQLLTQRLIGDIDPSKYQAIYLDATDFGYPVYKKLGFELETEYVHLQKAGSFASPSATGNIVQFRVEFREQLLGLDARISGENRAGILADFLSAAKIYLDGGEVQGYYMPDWGDGPIIAGNDVAGLELMKLRSFEKDNAVLPCSNLVALDFLTKNGFETYKTSKRMIRGTKREWRASGIYNRISGQLG